MNFQDVWYDNYYFERQIGSGAFGTVWKVSETDGNRAHLRNLAVKVFEVSSGDHDSISRLYDSFLAELRALAQFIEEPIVTYHLWKTDDFYVDVEGKASRVPIPGQRSIRAMLLFMDYADGGHLDATYRQEMIQAARDSSYLTHFSNICAGLKALHSNGIFHKDIKPENLLWFKKGNQVKIADFGIASIPRSDKFHPETLQGTMHYMSPESFESSIPTAARDIYALGCTLFEIFVGDRPFDDQTSLTPHSRRYINAKETWMQFAKLHQLADRPDAFVRVPQVISTSLSAVIRQMMSLKPEDRPSLDQVMEALSQEKRRRFPDVEARATDALPAKPILRSTHLISPAFRKRFLQENVFFISLRLDVKSDQRKRAVFAILAKWFGATFSIAEVYGLPTFVVRVWSTRPQVTMACKALISDVLDDNGSALQVMPCDDVEYVGAAAHPLPSDLDLNLALSKLAAVQASVSMGSEPEHSLVTWLRQKHIYVRPIPRELGPNTVPAICFVSERGQASESERDLHFGAIERHCSKSATAKRLVSISIYKRAYQPLAHYAPINCDYVITYTSPSIDDVGSILTALVDDMRDVRLRTETLIATKRLFVSSDNISDSVFGT